MLSLRARLLNDAAGDAGSGISRGVGLVIVRVGVNHERSASRVEERIRARRERHVTRSDGDVILAASEELNVRQVACVCALWVRGAVLFHSRVEMAAGAGEVRRVALADGVNVQRVGAGR